MEEAFQLERYRAYIKAHKKYLREKTNSSYSKPTRASSPYVFEDAWWLLGDPGNPLLGKSSLELIRKSVNPQTFEKILEEATNYSKRSANDLKRKLNSPALSEISLQNVMSILERDTDFLKSVSDQYFFAPEKESYEEPLVISQLPLSQKTSFLIEKFHINQHEQISALNKVKWTDLFIEDGNLSPCFEIHHLLNDWLPQAKWNGVIPSANADLDEVAEALSLEMNYRAGRGKESQKYGQLIRLRNGWGVQKQTLDQFGELQNVTRERIRQIERAFMLIGTRSTRITPKSIEKVIGLSFHSTNGNVMGALRTSVQNNSKNWNLESLSSLLSFYKGEDFAEEWLKNSQPSKQDLQINEENIKAIRNARSMIGIISMRNVVDKQNGGFLSKEKVTEIIRSVYARAFFDSDYALVSTSRGSSGLENSVMKQLSVRTPLHFEVLYEGIARTARMRGASKTLPTPKQVSNLLKQSDLFEVDDSGLVTGKIKEKEPEGTVEGWILSQLKLSPSLIKSKAELFRSAISEGRNLASVNQYLTYSPLFRSSGDGLVFPVGFPPTEDAITFAKAVLESLTVKGQFSIKVLNDSSLQAEVQLGTTFLISGVFSIPSQASTLLAGKYRRVLCCENGHFDNFSKVSGSFWSGFAGLRDHLFVDHGLKEDSWVTFHITDDLVQVTSGTSP